MKKFILLSAIVMFLGLTADTFGQGHNRSRIRSGIRSGQITRNEARELRERRRELRQEGRVFRSDGTVTRAERREIRRDRRDFGRQIRNERRDDDRNNGYSYGRRNHRRGNGYYRRGAGSPSHPVFGSNNWRRGRH